MYMHRLIAIEAIKEKTKRGINIFDSRHNYNLTSTNILELLNNAPMLKNMIFTKSQFIFS